MNRRQHVITILILGALATISPFSIDMYLPGFPAIAADLETSIAQVQLSLTSYLVGIAAGQLLYGPLLDRFGRKSPLYAGLIIYVLTSLGCSITVDAPIAMRFLQALGGCAGIVAAQALVELGGADQAKSQESKNPTVLSLAETVERDHDFR